ncbi:hypothetical protein Skr01_33610 [Sphaerisporangium krabiense]|nr:hypothetical protein Skr01_33610 [Sphaerisporangium krabiense]
MSKAKAQADEMFDAIREIRRELDAGRIRMRSGAWRCSFTGAERTGHPGAFSCWL